MPGPVISCMEKDIQRCNSMMLDSLSSLRKERKELHNYHIIKENIKRFEKAKCACGCKKRGFKKNMHPEIYRNRNGYAMYQIKWYFKKHKPVKRNLYLKRDV